MELLGFNNFQNSKFYILYSGRLGRLSPSQRFFFVCVSFVVGVSAASFVTVPLLVVYAAAWAAVVVATLSIGRHATAATISVAVLACLLGVARHEVIELRRANARVRAFVGSEQVLVGRVVSDSVPQRQSVRYHFVLSQVSGAAVVNETVSVVARPFPEVAAGDILKLRCRLELNERYGQSEVSCVFPEVIAVDTTSKSGASKLAGLRRLFIGSLQRVFPEPAAGFVAGLLVGGRAGLPASWREALNATGTAHLVALSGYNITIIAGVVLSLLVQLAVPRRWRLWVVAVVLGSFVIMVGAPASVVRAAIMGMLVVLARHLGRPSQSRNAIAFTAVVMLAINPTLLRFDLGFQLSFLATLGIVYLFPHLERLVVRLPEWGKVKEAFLMAIAAEIFVTPLILYQFGQLSLVAPFVNALIVPPVPFIMFFGFLGGLGGFVATPLGQIVGVVAWALSAFVLGLIELAAALPFAAVNVVLPFWAIVCYYVALAGWLITHDRRVKPRVVLPL